MEKNIILSISKLYAAINDKPVLHDINLVIESGSVHALMGPNGSGKSSLACTLMGHPYYTITQGVIMLDGMSIIDMPVHERARNGLFLSFQYPCEIPGVSIVSFLKEAYSAVMGQSVSVIDFQKILIARCEQLMIDSTMIFRGFNEGFSGGEKKRLELLQLLLLRPKIAILDEIDSGLDVDSLKIVAQGIELARKENPTMSIVLITHYQRILNYVVPDYVHVLSEGRIVSSGDASIAHMVELKGYAGIENITT